MLESILKALKALFEALFGGPSSGGKTTDTTKPTPQPDDVDLDDAIAQDASEVTPDTVVVVTHEVDLEVIDKVENENAPQSDTSYDENVFDEKVNEVDVPSSEDETTDDTSSEDETSEDSGDTTTDTAGDSSDENTTTEPHTPDEVDIDDPVADEVPPTTEEESQHEARYLWCLDNGHGKLTSGKRSPVFDDGKTQFFEYEFNRDIVKRIIKKLDKLGVKYFNVVPEVEVGNSLEERVNRANNKQSDLPKIYVSIHSNAAPAASSRHWAAPSISGIETWYFHGSAKGRKLASVFHKHLIAKTGWKNRHLKSKSQGQFYVLRKTRMPAVLTENGFYNNKAQAKELMKDSVRQAIADAHVAAILELEEKGL